MVPIHLGIALALLTLFVQQAPAPATVGGSQWPVDQVVPAGTPGVTPPRLIKEVKPTYPSAAMRARVQGVVVLECIVEPDGSVGPARILRSLDTVYGLDEEALKTIAKWRFAPAKRDGTPVRTAVKIEMAFTIRDRAEGPVTTGWPDSFAVSSEGSVSSLSGWSRETVRADDVEFEVAYPAGWSLRRDPPGALISLEADDARGHRSLRILRTARAPLQLVTPLGPAALKASLVTLEQMSAAQAGDVRTLHSGQVKAGDTVWLWLEMAAPVADLAGAPPELRAHLREAHDGVRLWMFATTAGGRYVSVSCTMFHAANTTDAEKQEEVRLAGLEFGGILQRLSIRAR